MQTLKQKQEENSKLLKNYRDYLKVTQVSYAFEKRLIDEINRLQVLSGKLFFTSPLQKRQLLNQEELQIQSKINYENSFANK